MSDKYTLDEIRDMLGKITPGTWLDQLYYGHEHQIVSDNENDDVVAIGVTPEDAAFIAAAPDIARQLLARADEQFVAEVDADDFAQCLEENGRLSDKVKALEAYRDDLIRANRLLENDAQQARAEVARLRGNVSEVD